MFAEEIPFQPIPLFPLAPRSAGESPMHFAHSSLFILLPLLCCACNFSQGIYILAHVVIAWHQELLELCVAHAAIYSFIAWAPFYCGRGEFIVDAEALRKETNALNCKIKCVWLLHACKANRRDSPLYDIKKLQKTRIPRRHVEKGNFKCVCHENMYNKLTAKRFSDHLLSDTNEKMWNIVRHVVNYVKNLANC